MYRHIPQKRTFGWADLFVLAVVAAFIYGLVGFAQQWTGSESGGVEIDLSPAALPRYAFFSFSRAIAAYCLSLSFTLVYGYVAAKSRRAERVMIPFLDILQSIPVLGFLPSLILGLVAVFPDSNIGIELACIIMIFTGQAWNMTFSFYSSVKSVPADLNDVSKVIRMSWWHRFKFVELPFSAIGLAWNSLMSMAGGWFFLTVCESFTLGEQRFRLPGIGAYMSTAIEQGNSPAMVYGVTAMAALIIISDFLIWRPVMAWVRKFQMEEIPEEVAELPFVTTLLRESWLIRRIKIFMKRRIRHKTPEAPVSAESAVSAEAGVSVAVIRERFRRGTSEWGEWLLEKLTIPVTILVSLAVAIYLWELVRPLSIAKWKEIWSAVGLTFLRVFVAVVLGSLWTIPVAILVGLSPRLTRVFQPVVQVIASFPAPMIYPVAIAIMFKLGVTMSIGAAILMMIGVQWYIMFNALAGAMAITRDLKDSMVSIHATRRTRWLSLYLPAAFPYLVTGWIAAAGGAWNASIVAEYMLYGGELLITPGIGSMISQATAEADFPLLAGCLIAMVVTVVGLNQTWWRWLGEMAETRFRFER